MFFDSKPNRYERLKFFEYVNRNFKNVESGVFAKSILGSDVHYFKIGKGKRQIFSVASHHGMEHISTVAIYNAIVKIADNLTRGGTSHGINLAFLLQKFTFWFVPCLNVDGVDLVLQGAENNPLKERQIKMNGGEDFSLWQANARGVDLNHNYDFRFFEYKRREEGENILPGRTRYSGEYPESEPEVRATASFIRYVLPELILSFHTQGEEIYFRPRSDLKTFRLAKQCEKLSGYSVATPTGLSDFGGLSDYAGERLGISSLTLELGRGENPLPYSRLVSISELVYKLHVLLPTYL